MREKETADEIDGTAVDETEFDNDPAWTRIMRSLTSKIKVICEENTIEFSV